MDLSTWCFKPSQLPPLLAAYPEDLHRVVLAMYNGHLVACGSPHEAVARTLSELSLRRIESSGHSLPTGEVAPL